MTTLHMDIVSAMNSPKLFRSSFEGESWNGMRTILKAAYCLPMDEAEKEFFRSVAQREPPRKRVRELWIIAGRRSGKDSISSLIMAHTAAFFNNRKRLRSGEIPLCLCLACDRDQAKIVLNYTKAFYADIPALRKLVRRETATGLELTNNVEISVGTNSYRSVRGRPILCAILDEAAFYRDESSALSDEALYAALRPGMATLAPDSVMIVISTPYRKAGLLYRKYCDYFGKDSDDVLVIKAATRLLNPTIDQAVIDAAMIDDPADANAEWYAVFRDDISGWVTRELVEQAVDRDVIVRPPRPGTQYFAFVDGSGGMHDSYCAAVAHQENGVAVLDCLIEIRPPYNHDSATAQIAAMFKQYRCTSVIGDHYSGEWIVQAFAKCGITYRWSDRNRSDIYIDCLPLFTTGRARILDNKRLTSQFYSLERKPTASGDKVNHGPGGHDDCANVAAGAMVLATADKLDVVPIVGPIIIGGRHDTPIPGSARQPGQTEEAYAAKERAKLPSVPRTPAAPGVNSTQAYYEWVDSGGGGGPPGGWTRRERFGP